MSSFHHVVIILPKQYLLNSTGERGQPGLTHLVISASLDSLELNFINILFCVYVPSIAFNDTSGIFIDFRISNNICLCICSASRITVRLTISYPDRYYVMRDSDVPT